MSVPGREHERTKAKAVRPPSEERRGGSLAPQQPVQSLVPPPALAQASPGGNALSAVDEALGRDRSAVAGAPPAMPAAAPHTRAGNALAGLSPSAPPTVAEARLAPPPRRTIDGEGSLPRAWARIASMKWSSNAWV